MHNWALKQLGAEKRTVNNCLQWEFYTLFKYNKLSPKIYLSTVIKQNLTCQSANDFKMHDSCAIWGFIFKARCHESLGLSTLVFLLHFQPPWQSVYPTSPWLKCTSHFSKHRVVLNKHTMCYFSRSFSYFDNTSQIFLAFPLCSML